MLFVVLRYMQTRSCFFYKVCDTTVLLSLVFYKLDNIFPQANWITQSAQGLTLYNGQVWVNIWYYKTVNI